MSRATVSAEDMSKKKVELPRGTAVEIHGIASKSSLNGAVGVVSGVANRDRISAVIGQQRMYFNRASLKRLAGVAADEAWAARAYGNVWVSEKSRDGWVALLEFLERQVLQALTPWNDTAWLRRGETGLAKASFYELSQEERTRLQHQLREPLLLAHAAFLQLGGPALVGRTEMLTIHNIGWSCERINRVAWSRDEYRAAQDEGVEFLFNEPALLAVMKLWSPILRRMLPKLASLHIWGFGPEAPDYDHVVEGEWLRLSLRPGLYKPTAEAEQRATVAFMPAIWDGIWPADGGCTALTGHALDGALVSRAGSARFHDHVKLTSGALDEDPLGRRAPFASLWRASIEALRDSGRPVLITCANVGEEQLSIRNLRVVLGPEVPIYASMSPFAMPDLPGMHPSAAANQTHRKFVPYIKGMTDIPSIQSRLGSQGWSNFLILFNVQTSVLKPAAEPHLI